MITVEDIKQAQKDRKGKSIRETKVLGQELCDKFGITPMQALDIVFDRFENELDFLKRVKFDDEGNAYYIMENGMRVSLKE